MQVLVTGGAGFIGGHLIFRLLKEGHRVRVIERYTEEKKIRLSALGKQTSLTVHWMDLSHPDSSLHQIMQGVDWVFHLSGRAGTADFLAHPHAYHDMHVKSTVNLLEACRGSSARRFVYLGSTAWYPYSDTPLIEQSIPFATHPYALVKYLAEQYVAHWHRIYKIPSVTLRPFTVYGPAWYPGGTSGPGITAFLIQKRKGIPYTVMGKGEQRRDFIYVTDLANACISIAKSQYIGAVHVGSGMSHSIIDVIKGMGGGKVTYIPFERKEPRCMQGDISKMMTLTGWRPFQSFTDGMRAVCEIDTYWQKQVILTPARYKESIQEAFRMMEEMISRKK